MSSYVDQKVDAMRGDLAKRLKKWDRPVWGYTGGPAPERSEGETWTDDEGKQWIVKNGIKQSITKLQDAKTPWWCPKCEKAMGHRFDTKFYRLYNQCYDCTIKQHTQMMIDGTWESFEKKMIRENEKAYLRDMIQERKDYIRTFKLPQVHFENGGWETLATMDQFKELFANIRNDIKFCEDRLAEIEKEEQEEQSKHGDQNAW